MINKILLATLGSWSPQMNFEKKTKFLQHFSSKAPQGWISGVEMICDRLSSVSRMKTFKTCESDVWWSCSDYWRRWKRTCYCVEIGPIFPCREYLRCTRQLGNVTHSQNNQHWFGFEEPSSTFFVYLHKHGFINYLFVFLENCKLVFWKQNSFGLHWARRTPSWWDCWPFGKCWNPLFWTCSASCSNWSQQRICQKFHAASWYSNSTI